MKILLLFLIFFPASFTFGGGNVSGGGEDVLLDIKSISSYIAENCRKWPVLATVRVSCIDLKKQINAVETANGIEFVDEELADSVSYKKGVPKLTFNRRDWVSLQDDVPSKVKIAIVGYLGLMGHMGNKINEDIALVLADKLRINARLEKSTKGVFHSYNQLQMFEKVKSQMVWIEKPQVKKDGTSFRIGVDEKISDQIDYATTICNELDYPYGIYVMSSMDSQIKAKKKTLSVVRIEENQTRSFQEKSSWPVLVEKIACAGKKGARASVRVIDQKVYESLVEKGSDEIDNAAAK